MYLLFDTETTGLPKNWKAPVSDVNNWPRMVQLAWLLYDDGGNLLNERDYLIKPEGYTIPENVVKIHGISTEKALTEGKELRAVLNEFISFIEQANYLVAHNISFDEKIVGCEFVRCSISNPIDSKKKICTMLKSTNYVGIQGQYGYKWPNLSELHYKLFKTNFTEAHNAAADIKATAKCFWELRRLGKI